ncbi:hypothetical protein [Micromonospora ureilytica]|uniref:hypothetical protein n=1 Tax=Micromonospora ureilytica TaxID=709868 RepID=UPI003F4D047B
MLDEFSAHVVGLIDVVHEFRSPQAGGWPSSDDPDDLGPAGLDGLSAAVPDVVVEPRGAVSGKTDLPTTSPERLDSAGPG